MALAGGGDPETAVLCCTWLTVCGLFVRSTRGRTELSVGLRRTMVKQPTTIKISGSVRPAHSHIVMRYREHRGQTQFGGRALPADNTVRLQGGYFPERASCMMR